MKKTVACLIGILGLLSVDKTLESSDAMSFEEVFVGTWYLCGIFDKNGDYVPIGQSGFQGKQSFTFVKDGTFSAVFIHNPDLDLSFSGRFDYSESQRTGKNPYKWIYYATGNPESVSNKGTSVWGRNRLDFIFQFINVNGRMLLYDGITRLYYEKK
jgi:hypothetical protein